VYDEQVFALLDFPAYFGMAARPQPENRRQILSALADDKLIVACEAGGWNITNLGAMLFAKRLDDFETLRRKAIRVIQFRDKSRVQTLKELQGNKGYACGFEGLIGYLNGLLPANEIVGPALRRSVTMYPELAIRELTANTLIHQDFSMTGVGPTIELFADRIEITNPGIPLMDTQRFVDAPPQSRNERLASLMRRLGICEERGSGWDKIVFETELYQLPAPLVEATDTHTSVVLFSHRSLSEMDRADRIRAVYLHACLKYVNREHMTNTTVRSRFGIEQQNSAIASRLLREAVDAGLVFPYDENAAPKLMRYVPFWAVPNR
jgi:predicted HTH transcriptional regulator